MVTPGRSHPLRAATSALTPFAERKYYITPGVPRIDVGSSPLVMCERKTTRLRIEVTTSIKQMD